MGCENAGYILIYGDAQDFKAMKRSTEPSNSMIMDVDGSTVTDPASLESSAADLALASQTLIPDSTATTASTSKSPGSASVDMDGTVLDLQ
ncbi:MAG: hypothetical protein Q9217_006945, partial [Psora testacea]